MFLVWSIKKCIVVQYFSYHLTENHWIQKTITTQQYCILTIITQHDLKYEASLGAGRYNKITRLILRSGKNVVKGKNA